MWMGEGNGPLSGIKHLPPALPCFLLPREKRIEELVWGGRSRTFRGGDGSALGVGLNANDSSASFSFRA